MHPGLVPQMAGAEEVLAALDGDGRTAFSALVLNPKGLDRAIAAGAREAHLAYPLTDTFAARNQNTTVAQAAADAVAMIRTAHDAGLRATATLGVAFGCPFEGRVDPGIVVDHAARMAAAGADEIMLADTIGVGVPRQVRGLVSSAAGRGRRRAGRAAPAQHAQHGLRERRRRARRRREAARRVDRRPGRLPVRAARDGQHRDGGPRLPARGRGRRHGRRPRRADRRDGVARGRARARPARAGAPAGGFP